MRLQHSAFYCIIAATELRELLQPVLHITEENIEATDTSQAYLLVQSGNGFIGFASFLPVEKKVCSWVVYQQNEKVTAEELQQTLSSISAEHTWVHPNYKRIIIVQYGAGNALIPSAFNAEMTKHRLVEMMNGYPGNSLLLRDVVLEQSLVNYYTVPKATTSLLNQRFAKGEWYHVQSLLLTEQPSAETKITATIGFNELQLIVEKNGKWLLLQTYQFQTPEDALYYILNAMQQLNLSQEETTVILQGWIDQRSALYNTLYSYILNLKLKDELKYQFPAAGNQPAYLSASLDEVVSCVS